MNAIPPVVRYLIVCEDIRVDAANRKQVTLVNVVSAIQSRSTPPFPVRQPEICIFVQIAECRGGAHCQIRLVSDTQETIFQSSVRELAFGNDPLEVFALSFRFRNCPFTRPGHYWAQFWYNGALVAQQTFEMR